MRNNAAPSSLEFYKECGAGSQSRKSSGSKKYRGRGSSNLRFHAVKASQRGLQSIVRRRDNKLTLASDEVILDCRVEPNELCARPAWH